MNCVQISKTYKIPYKAVIKIKNYLNIKAEEDYNINREDITRIFYFYKHKKSFLNTKTKLLVYEYKERYPILSAEDISNLFCIPMEAVKEIFAEEFLTVPSKLNSRKLISLSNG